MTGGLCYEGLSDAGASGEPIVIILNDNGMSINESVGAISKLLSGRAPTVLFSTSKVLTGGF
jgi:1-deoxy-D-xylulose-5-phosphate synthase